MRCASIETLLLAMNAATIVVSTLDAGRVALNATIFSAARSFSIISFMCSIRWLRASSSLACSETICRWESSSA